MQYSYCNLRSVLGFSLIELLLAMAISVTALLGFAQLQQKNLSIERELTRSLHTHLLLNEISTILQTTPYPQYYSSNATHSSGASNCLQKVCLAEEFAQFQLALWNCRLAERSSWCRNLGIARPLFSRARLSIGLSGQHFLIRLQWQTLSGQEKTTTQKITNIYNRQ